MTCRHGNVCHPGAWTWGVRHGKPPVSRNEDIVADINV